MTRRPFSPAVAALLILAAGYAGFTVYHLALTLPFPWPLSYPEGVLLSWLGDLAAGEPLYPPVGLEPPFRHNPWPPFFYWLAWPLVRAGLPALAAARLLSTLAGGVAAACLVALVRGRAAGGWALAAGALFLFSPVTMRFLAAARVDMVGLACALGAVLAMQRRRGALAPALAGLLCALALLTKPTFIAAVPACLLLARARGRRATGFFAAAGIAATALLLLPARQAWGPALATHLVTLNRLPLTFPLLAANLFAVLPRHLLLVAALALFLKRPAAGEVRPPVFFYVAATLVGLVFAARTGAEENYFLELIAAGALAAGCLAGRLPARARPAAAWALAAQLALYLPVQPAPVFTRTYGQELAGAGLPALTPRAEDRVVGETLAALLRAVRDPVLCQAIGYLPLTGRDIILQPYQFAQLHRLGRWDDTPVVEQLRAGAFELVVLKFDPESETSVYFTPAVSAAVRDHYYHLRHIGPWHVFEPR